MTGKASLPKKVADNVAKGAMSATLEELFQDMYTHRWKIYKMNLVRGVMFGFGTVIGGTIIVGLLLWAMSLFNHVPFVGDVVGDVQHSIQKKEAQ